MYGSVAEPAAASNTQVAFDPSEEHGLLSAGKRPSPIVCKVISGVVLVTAIISAVIFFCFTPGAPPPPPPPPPPPKCQPGQLDIYGDCHDKSEFGVTADERAFVFENHATFTVWVAGIGPPTYNAKPEITGFELAPGKWNVVGLPANLESIRFWPRTGCRYVEDTISLMGKNVNITKFRCDTGDCGSILNDYGMQCRSVSGLPPATLAEFSLSTKGNDFYDLSNVDGYNVGMKIEPYNYERAGVDDPTYDCGAPGCVMDTHKCPEELKLVDVEGVTHCLSICQAINNEKQRNKFKKLMDLWEGTTDRGFMKDLLCCDCGDGNGLCESLGSPCTYGCSPFVISYTDAGYKTRKCDKINGTYLPDWPPATNGENYASVFNKQCPQAYSWQFNDDQSTYQCRKADYKIQFLSTHKKN
jgi:hypothetical protein|eukprot:CAMPEP_0174285046 /NCGR_PEP_ID=MMETSP0809-20121228/7492_1 /TAXON_ID=73025 ORGANISM="Eutreptiella gymnastica-like, Strain CCMP1594" /NCGR_SAMPLE_ID=MMETSP0809 /ASSEMBLY_ACC=CAM_ASM_000658 /LENGTH=413 /DNA_ID=CAMNT_0015380729 /DNA_START=20 /DNA_END=1261 /DNA_ORIENTATION=-